MLNGGANNYQGKKSQRKCMFHALGSVFCGREFLDFQMNTNSDYKINRSLLFLIDTPSASDTLDREVLLDRLENVLGAYQGQFSVVSNHVEGRGYFIFRNAYKSYAKHKIYAHS